MKQRENVKKTKSSPDYSLLARKIVEASGDEASSKLSGLYIVATPIGNLGDISLRALTILTQVSLIACEDTRISGAMLAKFGIKARLISYHDHNENERRAEILAELQQGKNVALISDAGMPLIADPGYRLVRDCRAALYDVTVIPGANAALTALAGSGLPTDAFFFAGFLPPKTNARQKAIAVLRDIPATLVFYEAPQRLVSTLHDLEIILGTTRDACVVREITKLYEETKQGSLHELAKHYGGGEVKGEIVIIVGPPGETAAVEITEIDKLLEENLLSLSVRDAAAIVSAITGAKKSEVYKRALALAKKEN